MSEQLVKAKKLNAIAWGITVAVIGLVILLQTVLKGSIETNMDFSFLPLFHSCMNVLCAICLVLSLVAIKKKNIKRHQRFINLAMLFSLLFLLSYVTYHITGEPDKYQGEGIIKIIYFIILASHIILAAIIFPFILFTYIRAYTSQIEKHRRMAKWVFPLWLYVAISGPTIYFMLEMAK